MNTLARLKIDKHLKKVNFLRILKYPSEGNIVIPDTGVKINDKILTYKKTWTIFARNSQEILEEIGFSEKEVKKF